MQTSILNRPTRVPNLRTPTHQAIRIERFGTPDVIRLQEIDQPVPGPGQVLVRVKAAGVGPWDALIRAGHSALVKDRDLPLTLGSDIAGVVEFVGPEARGFAVGTEIFGVTNAQFIGGYAQFAVASAEMIAIKPRTMSFQDAASVPVVAVTAWQMLFAHAKLKRGQTVLVLGAAGNVGAYAVQLARSLGVRVIATGAPDEVSRLCLLGADEVVDFRQGTLRMTPGSVDAVIDTVGGSLQAQAVGLLRPGGKFVSAVSQVAADVPRPDGVLCTFFYVDVTTQCLSDLSALIDAGMLQPCVGAVLPLSDARVAHEMLDGLRPRPRGKIVLSVS